MVEVVNRAAVINNNPLDYLLSDCDFEHQVEVTNKRSPIITISIFNHSFPALIDTGSEVSCMSGDVYSQLGQFHKDIPCFPVTGVRITGAFRTKERRITHQMLVTFFINNSNFKHEFLLISDLIFPIILGADFLRTVAAEIHLAKNKIVIYSHGKTIEAQEINPKHSFIGPLEPLNLRTTAVKQNNFILGSAATDRESRGNSTLNLDFVNNISFLNPEQKRVFSSLLIFHKKVFSDIPGRTHLYQHKIILTDETPFKIKQYPIPFAHREAVFKEIEKMERWGVIERAATPFINPLVTAVKRDGTVRVCLDARRLNTCMERDYELPRPIDEILKSLSGARFKTCLDLSASYFQIPLREEDKKFTGFLVGTKTYQFTVLPFGLCTAVSSFSRAMSQILGPEFEEFVIAYVDDLLIFSNNFEDHMQHLGRVLERLSDAGFTLRFKKCKFMPEELHYLGYILTFDGIKPDPVRTDAIANFPVPKNVKALQSFLGLCNYDRGFCENFSSMAEPLTRLLRKKTKWAWLEEQAEAFDCLKSAIKNEVFLYHPDHNLEFYVQSDASDYGLGAQLFQCINGQRRVVAYASRLLLDRERAYNSCEKEILAVVFSLLKWRTYLLGRHFHILTDARALIYIQTCRLLSPRITRWALALQEYDFTIHYVRGKDNLIADVLSRNPSPRLPTPSDRCFKLYNLQIKLPLVFKSHLKNLPTLQLQDPKLGPVWQSLKNGESLNSNDYVFHKDLLFMRRTDEEPYVLCLPSVLVNDCVKIYHEFLGHFGVYKTWQAIKQDFFWSGMFKDIKKYIKHCDLCQRTKVSLMPKPPIIPIIPDKVNEIISLDLYGPLPRSRGGATYLCVIIDIFSKYITLYPLKKATSKAILNRLLLDYFPKFGRVGKILTDHGSQFTSKLWPDTLTPLGVKCVFSSIRHPQSNPVERYMRELSRLFRTYCAEKHTRWAHEVTKFSDFLNSVTHESTSFSPRELQLGDPPFSLMRDHVEFPAAAGHNPSHETKLILAKETMQGRAARRGVARPSVPHVKFNPGDLVLLKSNPMSSALTSETKKFLLLFEGPFRIKKSISSATYILCFVNSEKERGSFHASHLKPYFLPNDN